MNVRCIAVDDEPFALELIKKDINRIPFLSLVGTYTNPFDAREVLNQEAVDLIFLDIQMPTISGLQFLRSLTKPPLVIISTAYTHYALEGFDLDVVDYIVKPTAFERFLKAVNKAYTLLEARQREPQSMPVTAITRSFFFVYSDYREIKIFHDEVLYAQGLKDYVKLYTIHHTSKPLLIRMSLKTLETKLVAHLFCRVHNSFIISLAHITSFQRSKLFIGTCEIPIGKNFAQSFERLYRAYL